MGSIKNISIMLAVFLSLCAVVVKVSNIDARYAKAAEVAMIAERLDNKIIQDRMDNIQERLWRMEDVWGERFSVQTNRIHDTLEELIHFMHEEARDMFRRLQKDYAALEKELEDDD